jgi:hypothetical protein
VFLFLTLQVTTSPASIFGQSFGGFQFNSLFTSSFPWQTPRLVESDRWAFGTCTLKKAVNTKKPTFEDAAASESATCYNPGSSHSVYLFFRCLHPTR